MTATATGAQLDLFHFACEREVRQQQPAPRGENVQSRAAYAGNAGEFRGRERLIEQCLRLRGVPMTDREIKDAICGAGADMNTVRPRINDMMHKGALRVMGKQRDHVTGEMVRTVYFVN